MLFEQIRNNTSLDVLELKFVCELFLDKLGLDSERKELVKMTADDLEESIENLSNKTLIDYVMTRFVKNEKHRQNFNKYLTDFFSRHTREDIPYVYSMSNAGRKIVERCLRRQTRDNEKHLITPEVVTEVQKLFAKVTRKRYTMNFRNEGAVEAYLTHCFDEYFIKGYSREITELKDPRSTYVKGSDGEVSVFELRATDQIDERVADFNIPNFKDLAYLIYKGSKALKYRAKVKQKEGTYADTNVLVYDIFSHYKYRILEERYDKFIETVSKEVRYSLKSKIKIVDINAIGYGDVWEDNNDSVKYSKRTYKSRQDFMDLVQGFNKDMSYSDQFEFIANYMVHEESGLAKYFDKIKRNETTLFVDTDSRIQHEAQYWDICQGMRATEKLISLLQENGIDPLSVPSDIFRNPDWFSKVEDLESYLKMYDNIKELEVEGAKIENIPGVYRNSELTTEFYGASLDNLKNRLLGDIKEILSKPTMMGNRLYDIVDSYRTGMPTLRRQVQDIRNKAQLAYNACIYFKRVVDDVTKANHYCRITNDRILEWFEVSTGTLDLLKCYGTLAERGNYQPQVGQIITSSMDFFLAPLNKERTDESYYDLIRMTSLMMFFSDKLIECFKTLEDLECTDLGIVDIINKHKSFIDLGDKFRNFRDIIDLEGGSNVYSCFPKGTQGAIVTTKMDPLAKIVIATFNRQFDLLRKIALNVEEEKNKTSSNDRFLLGNDEATLMKYANALELFSTYSLEKSLAVRYSDLEEYRDAYMVYAGKNSPVRTKRNGYTYYLHKSGVWVTAQLPYGDIRNKIKMGATESLS